MAASAGTAPDRDHADLTVAVIHYETPQLLDRCLDSLTSAAPAARLLVIDTSDRHPLPDEWAATHPAVELVRERNHSYSAAVNAALRRCRTSRFCQLNADVIVERWTFDELERAMQASGAAIAGPLAMDGEGRIQRNGLPYRWHQWRARRSGSWHYAPWLSGCLHYVRMESVERVGGMDTSLRFYNEDLEWCLRLRAAGEKCALVNTWITHLGGSSTPSSAEPIVEGMRGGYLVTRRYHGPLLRTLHRWGVFASTSVLARVARTAPEREAYRRVAAMMLRNDVEESPFGESLGSANPTFGATPATLRREARADR